MPGQKRTAYAAGVEEIFFKFFLCAKQSNNCMTAHHFNMNKKQVRNEIVKSDVSNVRNITAKAIWF